MAGHDGTLDVKEKDLSKMAEISKGLNSSDISKFHPNITLLLSLDCLKIITYIFSANACRKAKTEYAKQCGKAKAFKVAEDGLYEPCSPDEDGAICMPLIDVPNGTLKPKSIQTDVLFEKLQIGKKDSEDMDKMVDFIIKDGLNYTSLFSEDHKTSDTDSKNTRKKNDNINNSQDQVSKLPFENHSRFPANRPLFKQEWVLVPLDGSSTEEFECHFCETIKRCGTDDIHPKDYQENKVKTIQNVKTEDDDKFGCIGQLGTLSKAKNLSSDEMVRLATLTLHKCSFKISTTQRKTPKDGNCASWAIADQVNNYDPAYLNSPHSINLYRLRELVVASLPKMMKNGKIQSINSPKEWMRKMSRNGHCGDGVFLQLANAC